MATVMLLRLVAMRLIEFVINSIGLLRDEPQTMTRTNRAYMQFCEIGTVSLRCPCNFGRKTDISIGGKTLSKQKRKSWLAAFGLGVACRFLSIGYANCDPLYSFSSCTIQLSCLLEIDQDHTRVVDGFCAPTFRSSPAPATAITPVSSMN